jgi:hypothetical protein
MTMLGNSGQLHEQRNISQACGGQAVGPRRDAARMVAYTGWRRTWS